MNQPVRNPNTACQIFIGCLHQSVVESDLYQLTSQFGQVLYIRILRHIYTKEPMGLAFVSFSEPAAAQKARVELNGVFFKGKHINVTLYYKPRLSTANIFVNNLTPEFMARDLEQVFKNFGNIVSAKISYDPSNKSNRYGYVQFEKEEQAIAALNAQDQIFAATKVQVSKFVPLKERTDPHNNPNLYVRGFDLGYTQDQLLKVFSQFGEVSSSVIMRDGDRRGGDRGFAFVCFQNPEMASVATSALHNKALDGVAWYVMPHLKREARRKKLEAEFKEKREGWKKRNMIIKNLPQSMTEAMLHQLCDEYGEIESVKIHMTENITYQGDQKVPQMVSNGSAFVCYLTEDSARKAFISLRNKMIEGKNIYVAMWKPREELVKNINTKKYKMFNKQMMEYGAFNPMYMQQMKLGRGRAAVPQVMPQMMHPMMPQPVHRPPQHEQPRAGLGFDLNVFQNASPENQKRMLGEQLYPVVLKNSNDKIAGKITGMLLEIDHRNLIILLQNPSDLRNKVKEAIEVLRRAWASKPELLEQLLD